MSDDRLRLLLLDDNSDVRFLVLKELRQKFPNLQAIEVLDGESFLTALEQNCFNFVVTDYRLGWTTGLNVLRQVKERQPNCPVIMFTGTGSEEIAVEAMKAGLDDYISKSPQNYVRLAASVRLLQEREQQRRAFAEAESRYQRLFDGVPLGLYRLTAEGKILEANSMLVQMLGYPSQQELLAVNAVEQHLEPEARDAWKRQMKTQGIITNFETSLRRYDDSQIWVMHQARAVKDEQGMLYYEGAIEDITARKLIEQERAEILAREQEARREAETANRLKDEFLATLSHELRTPLNSIFGWIQLLRKGTLSEEQKDRALEVIERNARSQKQLIEDLLDISRVIRGKMQLQLQPVDLARVIGIALDTVRPAAEAKKIQLNCVVASNTQSSLGDPERLQQVVWNLLANAIKFTPEEGSVTVSLECSPTHVFLQVKDTGQGIEAKVLPYIFERFRQVDGSSTRSHGGLGLGLAIVRYLVELHGGNVSADSPGIGQGATFTVQLPLLN